MASAIDWDLPNGCTGGPLSDFLNSMFQACCDRHDYDLSWTRNLADFIAGNLEFARCTFEISPVWGGIVSIAVGTPLALWYFLTGPKRPGARPTI